MSEHSIYQPYKVWWIADVAQQATLYHKFFKADICLSWMASIQFDLENSHWKLTGTTKDVLNVQFKTWSSEQMPFPWF